MKNMLRKKKLMRINNIELTSKEEEMVDSEIDCCPVCDGGGSIVKINGKCLRCGWPYYYIYVPEPSELEKELFNKINPGWEI